MSDQSTPIGPSVEDFDRAKSGQRNTPAWKVIAALIRFRPGYWTVNLLSMLVAMLAMLLPGLAIHSFFELLSDGETAGWSLWTLVALLVVAELARSIGLYGLIRTNVPFFVHTLTLIRKNMLSNILKRPGARALPDSPGEAISRFSGDAFDASLFALWLNDFIGIFALAGAAIAIMAAIDPWITAVALIPFAFVTLVAHAARNRIEQYRVQARRWTGIVVGFISETFGAIQAAKVARAEDGLLRQFERLNGRRKKAAVMDRVFQEVLNSIFLNSANLGTGVVLILAAEAIRDGGFSIADFALFVFYLEFVSELTAFAGMLLAKYKQIGVSVQRMERLMEGAPPESLITHSNVYVRHDHPDVPGHAAGVEEPLERLDVRGLTYRFPPASAGDETTENDSTPVQLDQARGIVDINFSLARGTFTVVTGSVGAGKTTLLRVLLGLLDKDSGEVRYNGRVIDDPAEFFVPPRTAYTSQVPRLFSETLRSNILFGIRRDDRAILSAIHSAVMDRDMAALDDGLDTPVGPRGVKLSGGQVQRTAAARMYVREPELFVFDDLSSALDVNTERELWRRMDDLGGSTALVVSHRRTALERADQILLMADGRLVATGRLPELLASQPLMQRLWTGDDDTR